MLSSRPRIHGLLAGAILIVAWAPSLFGPTAASARRSALASIWPDVIGGEAAEEETFPSVAHIEDFHANGMVGMCTGTVVAPRLVLTAAHCLVDKETQALNDPAAYRVTTGNVDWTAPSSETIAVTRTVVYGGYEPTLANDDAGLLVLASPSAASPAKLARRPQDAYWLQPGEGAWIVGWGDTEYGQEEATAVLHYAETAIQGQRWCRRNAPPFSPRDELCVIDPPDEETGACHGDSGGPLIVSEEGAEEVDVGISSHAYGHCLTYRPSVYTRVDAVYPWVQRWARAVG